MFRENNVVREGKDVRELLISLTIWKEREKGREGKGQGRRGRETERPALDNITLKFTPKSDHLPLADANSLKVPPISQNGASSWG